MLGRGDVTTEVSYYFKEITESRNGIDPEGGQGSLAEADMSCLNIQAGRYLCVPGAS